MNRPDGKRTAPAAHGKQYIGLYVVSGTGVYRYDAPGQRLELIREGNFKQRLSEQKHVGAASHVLQKRNWAHATAGTISQNVALMAAAKGIGTGVVGGIDARSISEALLLSPSQEPLYVMPLGYPP